MLTSSFIHSILRTVVGDVKRLLERSLAIAAQQSAMALFCRELEGCSAEKDILMTQKMSRARRTCDNHSSMVVLKVFDAESAI